MRPAPALTLTLPEPPSANRWWRNVRGRMVTSREARAYKARVAVAAMLEKRTFVAAFAKPQLVRVAVTWCRARKSGDLDKRLGVLLDALQGVCFETDAQVAEIHAWRLDREDGQAPGTVVVTVEPLDPAAAAGGGAHTP